MICMTYLMKPMDKFLLKAFQSLPSIEVPDELHSAIFRAAAFRRSWKYVSLLTVIIGLTFVFSLWHLYTRIIDTEALSSLGALFNSLDFSFNSIADSIRALIDFLPIKSITLSLLNLTSLIFMMFLMRSFAKLQTQFKI